MLKNLNDSLIKTTHSSLSKILLEKHLLPKDFSVKNFGKKNMQSFT